MDTFEFFFSLLSLLLGLALTQVASGLATMLKSRDLIRIGWLSPLAALLVCLDIGSFWPSLWSLRTVVEITTWPVLSGIALCLIYYVSAAFVFPETPDDAASLDQWFMANRRFALGGTLIAAALFSVVQIFIFWDNYRMFDGLEFVWQLRGWLVYVALMLVAIFGRSPRLAGIAMAAIVALYPLAPVLFE